MGVVVNKTSTLAECFVEIGELLMQESKPFLKREIMGKIPVFDLQGQMTIISPLGKFSKY